MKISPTLWGKNLIYLASPYSHGDPAVMQQRFDTVSCVVGILIETGFLIFSPILHSHPIAQLNLVGRGFKEWRRFDLTMLDKCDGFCVFKSDGWETSKGMQEEFQYARARTMPLFEYTDSREIIQMTEATTVSFTEMGEG